MNCGEISQTRARPECPSSALRRSDESLSFRLAGGS